MSEFDTWWQQRGIAVEEFNARRGGESGVERMDHPVFGPVFIKRQVNHIYRTFLHPFGQPTVLREALGLRVFTRLGLIVPEVVFIGTQNNNGQKRGLLVTKELRGFSDLSHWFSNNGRQRIGEENYRIFLQKLGVTFAQAHKHRWSHGSLYPQHVFVTPGNKNTVPEIGFIDLERIRKHRSIAMASKTGLHQLRRRHIILNGCHAISDDDWSIILSAHNDELYR